MSNRNRKPILVCYSRTENISEYEATKLELDKLNKDYYTLLVYHDAPTRFELFSNHDINSIDLDELKKKLNVK